MNDGLRTPPGLRGVDAGNVDKSRPVASRVADVKEIVFAIGHSPAVHLKAHGLGGDASWICLVTAGGGHIFVFWIKSKFDSKKTTTESALASQFRRVSVTPNAKRERSSSKRNAERTRYCLISARHRAERPGGSGSFLPTYSTLLSYKKMPIHTTNPRTLPKKREAETCDPNAENHDETEKRRPLRRDDLFEAWLHCGIRENAERPHSAARDRRAFYQDRFYPESAASLCSTFSSQPPFIHSASNRPLSEVASSDKKSNSPTTGCLLFALMNRTQPFNSWRG